MTQQRKVKTMPSWIRTLFLRRDNLISVVTVFVVTILLVLNIGGDVLTLSATIQGLLAILALLAISQIAERELRFGEIRTDLKKIEIDVARLAKPTFYKGSDLSSVMDFMKGAQELYYAGGHLHSLLHNNSNYFRQWLKTGRSLRFLLQDPENPGLEHLDMPCVNYAYRVYVEQIRDSIDILTRLKSELPSARLGVRVTNVAPTQSVAILDGDKGGTDMRILFHLPNGDSSSAPFSKLSRDEDGEWFQLFYERFYGLLWRKARILVRHPDEPQD